ncbi:MAG: Asp-tRNA(Asn)/Glu-tRNA(Gln) amidotransferase subunit GatB [Clostridia bacterium]
MEYDIVIGLETHVELSTATKVFCSCENKFGGEPNSHCCEVCTGMPGALPTINKKAVEYSIKAGLATHCDINQYFYFERKNYFYPDLAKAYQISQLVLPISINGYLEIKDADGNAKKIRINRIHLEEDAGKLVHNASTSQVDYNRGGVPLIETVSEPDLSSADEAISYLETLKALFKFIGVSDCKMEQGSLRCDVNVSLKPKGSSTLGNRTEMKNLNSFKAIDRAIRYEVERQRNILDNGGRIMQATLKWDDELGENYSMRSKEDAHDYRYFREPDLLPIQISNEEIARIASELPLLPEEKKKFYMENYSLTEYDASQITKSPVYTKFYDTAVSYYNNPKIICNWMLNELFKKLNTETLLDEEITINISPKNFASVARLYVEGKVSQQGSRQILETLFVKDEDPEIIMKAQNLELKSDTAFLEKVVNDIILANPQAVADYKGGNSKAFTFFMGQTMKATKGQASASLVSETINKLLNGTK